MSEELPRHWVGRSAVRTHLMNSLHLFLPSFERMIVRVVLGRACPRLPKDGALRAQARGLAAQEATHSRAHSACLPVLRAQGYRIDGWLRVNAWVFERLLAEHAPSNLTLAIVAAFEHYTDLLVRLALETDFLEGCDPSLRALLEWHSAEEIEHNAVAWEVLRALAPGYPLRMFGSVVGLLAILGPVLGGMTLLLAQDGLLFSRSSVRDLAQVFFTRYGLAREIAKLFVSYARPSYDPSVSSLVESARRVFEAGARRSNLPIAAVVPSKSPR